jgi:hypothetical protein
LQHPGPLTHGNPPYAVPFLCPPASSKAACVNLQNEQVSIMHHE